LQHVYGRRVVHRRRGGVRLLLLLGLIAAVLVGRQALPAAYREALLLGGNSEISCREFLEAVGAAFSSREAREMLWEKGVLEVFGLRREEAEEAAVEAVPESDAAAASAILGRDLLEYPVIPVVQTGESREDTALPAPPETASDPVQEQEAPPAEEAPAEPAPDPAPESPRTDEQGRVLPDIVSMEPTALTLSTVTPVYGVLTSGFGYRDHPIDGEFKFHYGVDLAAPTGTEVGSFAAGTVSFAGWGEINGYYIRVEHENGVETLYAHLSEILVSKGDRVDAGETIGLVGETGEASGPHLHFQVYVDGILVDPLQYVEYMV